MRVRSRMSRAHRAATIVATLVVGVWTPTGPARAQVSRSAESGRTLPLTEQEKAVHLLNRATYGARTQDIADVMRIGRTAWLEGQLHPHDIELESSDAAPSSTLAQLPPSQPTAVTAIYLRLLSVGLGPAPLVAAKVERATASPRQLEEVMTDFWFDHFNVYSSKAGQSLADYESSAIRAHVFGKFEDLLVATASHAAMMLYLDNYLSGNMLDPSSPAAGKLNENYARELLELHTLGVDGGYTQQDVIEVARAFTGWSVALQPGAAGRRPVIVDGGVFRYLPSWHDTGAKTVLGQKLPAGRQQVDGFDVLHLLASHPATARHIATKLAQRFVADAPPKEVVDELTRVFIETGGDLRAVTRAVFTSSTFYAPSTYRAKVRRPFEYVLAALRVSDGFVDPGAQIAVTSVAGVRTPSPAIRAFVTRLAPLRQVPYSQPVPTGYPVTAAEWVGGAAMIERLNFAIDLTAGRIDGGWVDAFWSLRRSAELAGLQVLPAVTSAPARYRSVAHALVSRILPGATPAEASALEASIAADVANATATEGTTESTLVMRALALALGSPAFQRY
jgi:uncharacterized protein (DUF1800 family)